jgi:hypothetical protein
MTTPVGDDGLRRSDRTYTPRNGHADSPAAAAAVTASWAQYIENRLETHATDLARPLCEELAEFQGQIERLELKLATALERSTSCAARACPAA